MNDRLQQHLSSDARREEFALVCDQTLDELTATSGIGTLSEKSTHAVLKRFYSGSSAYEEQAFCGFVADVRTPQGIFEIQTRSFHTMRRKLAAFLAEETVTIVYPVIYRKWLCWVDPETGAVSPPRLTGRRLYGQKIFSELYGIKEFLTHPNLRIQLALLEVEEYKLLDGYGPDRKRHATRNDGIPRSLIAEIPLNSPADYQYFLPDSLPTPFSTADLAAAWKQPKSTASVGAGILLAASCIRRVGKRGNAYLYEKEL